MKNKELLFNVFTAMTNAKGDVWKESQIKWHPGLNKNLIGKKKIRYTVPIMFLGETANKQKILLLIQTSTAKLNFNHFVIEAEKLSNKLKADLQYIYVFNVRVGLDNELLRDKNGSILRFGEIKEVARLGILNESLKLIKNTKRYKLLDEIRNHKFDDFNARQWNNIIVEQQFSREENSFRKHGNKKKIK